MYKTTHHGIEITFLPDNKGGFDIIITPEATASIWPRVCVNSIMWIDEAGKSKTIGNLTK